MTGRFAQPISERSTSPAMELVGVNSAEFTPGTICRIAWMACGLNAREILLCVYSVK